MSDRIEGEVDLNNQITVTRVAITDHRGFVCLTFGRRADALTLTAEEALTMSEALARVSYKAKFGDFPTGKTKQTIEQLRIRCRNRAELMLRKFRKEPPKTPHQERVQATAIVDEILKMVR